MRWRVAKGNLDYLLTIEPYLKKNLGADSMAFHEYQAVTNGMGEALKAGRAICQSSSSPGAASSARRPTTPVHGKVYFLTDGRCMSACLTFADLILSTEGVIHVGQPTSADSVYIETRSEKLPSGIGRLGFSMNIRSKGLRANNQPYIPAFVWDQDISDTKALEGWIQTLAK